MSVRANKTKRRQAPSIACIRNLETSLNEPSVINFNFRTPAIAEQPSEIVEEPIYMEPCS